MQAPWSPEAAWSPNNALRHRHSIGAVAVDTAAGDRDALEFLLQQRHSAPLLPPTSITSKETPESVRITGATRRSDHCVFELHISTGYETRVMYKRYSEFRELRDDLVHVLQGKQTHCNNGPCAQLLAQVCQAKFPRRRLKLPLVVTPEAELELARDRHAALERFIQVLLRVYRLSSRRHMRRCMHSECVVADMIKRFLQVVESAPTPSSASSSSEPLSPEVRFDATPAKPRLTTPRGSSRVASTRPPKDAWLFPIYEDCESAAA